MLVLVVAVVAEINHPVELLVDLDNLALVVVVDSVNQALAQVDSSRDLKNLTILRSKIKIF
jgi:hypothetical protein